MLSAFQHPAPVDKYIMEEETAGRVAEVSRDIPGLVINRFGVIPK